jgi:hypothetical protein
MHVITDSYVDHAGTIGGSNCDSHEFWVKIPDLNPNFALNPNRQPAKPGLRGRLRERLGSRRDVFQST